MYKLIAQIAIIGLFAGYTYMQRQDIESLELKNSNLQEQLKVCKSENKAKEFEQKWSEEFSKVYDLNSTALEATGVEDEETIKSGPNSTFTDTF